MTDNDKRQLKKITNNLNKRMSGYHSSLEPTNDDVIIAWLLTVIDELLVKHEYAFMYSSTNYW